jgi:hypothetical protein
MSVVKVQSNASGTGIFTIAAPATNTDRTLTLPDATGTIALQGGTGVGKVLQVVQSTTSTETNATTSTYIDTAITASITPSNSSSKVLVLVSANGLAKRDQNTSGNLRILRGSTTLIEFGGNFAYTNSTANVSVAGASMQYLDFPATTSSTTYKVQVVNTGNTGNIRVNWDTTSSSSITLLEIAA